MYVYFTDYPAEFAGRTEIVGEIMVERQLLSAQFIESMRESEAFDRRSQRRLCCYLA